MNREVFEWMNVFISSEQIHRYGIPKSCGKDIFNLIRNSQTNFQSGSTVLHFH